MIFLLASLMPILIRSATVLTVKQPSIATEMGNNTIPVSVADFGYVPYGHTVQGKLIYANDSCKALDLVKEFENTQMVVISERGNCSFLLKAQNTQKAGAIMLVIIDTFNENISEVLMISEQTNQVFIPTIMISKENGVFLKKLISEESKVIVSIFFELVQQKTVDLEYYMSSIDQQSYNFLVQFLPYAQKLNDTINFTPVYVQYYCTDCARKNWTVTNSLCISGGRYCAYDPDGNGPLIGRDIVMEDLRQLCIFQQNNKSIWWDYVTMFKQTCLDKIKNVTNLTKCSQETMKKINLNSQQIYDCVNKSFDGPNQLLDDSKILAKQREEFWTLEFTYWPSLTINGIYYRGDLYIQQIEEGKKYTIEQFAVLEAICDGFYDQDRPEICLQDAVITVDSDNKIIQQNNKVALVLMWIFISISLILMMLLALIFYKRSIHKQARQDLEGQVGQAFAQYYKMGEPAAPKNPKEKILNE